MTVEDNHHMKRSYIMIDPLGRFFQNGGQQLGYTYSAPINDVGAATAFQDIAFYADRFAERYSSLQQEGAV
jgi:radical S-adenosyl methionine domain-containing protein 2